VEEKTEKGGVIRPVFEKSYAKCGWVCNFFLRSIWRKRIQTKIKVVGKRMHYHRLVKFNNENSFFGKQNLMVYP